MFRALYKKELKSIFGWLPLLIAINLFLLSKLIEFDFLEEPLPAYIFKNFLIINSIIAAIIGFTQTALEHIRNTNQFLIFRPASPSKILAAKIASGLTVITLSLLIIFLRALYIMNNPEIMPSPWRWSMFNHLFLVYTLICCFYSGALLVGADNKNRWFGMKPAGLLIALCITYEVLYARSFTTGYIIIFFFGLILYFRLFEVYNNKKSETVLSTLPSILIAVTAAAAVVFLIFAQKIIGYKYNYYDAGIDCKNQIVLTNWKYTGSLWVADYYNENMESMIEYSNENFLEAVYFGDPYNFAYKYKRRLEYKSYDYYYTYIIENENKKNIYMVLHF